MTSFKPYKKWEFCRLNMTFFIWLKWSTAQDLNSMYSADWIRHVADKMVSCHNWVKIDGLDFIKCRRLNNLNAT